MGASIIIPLLSSLILGSAGCIAAPTASGAKKAPPKPIVTKAAPPTLQAGLEVTVADYDAKTDTFALELNATPGIGPNFVTPDNLRRGINYPGDLDAFMRQKSQMIGSIYQLKSTTILVSEDEMKRLEKSKSAL